MYEIFINNKPAYAHQYEYIVARLVDGELWFYGAWNDKAEADEVAHEVDGLVLRQVLA